MHYYIPLSSCYAAHDAHVHAWHEARTCSAHISVYFASLDLPF